MPEARQTGPGLHLLVDGTWIVPDIAGPDQYVFTVTLPAEEVRLVSRAAVPRETADIRLLGVHIRELTWEQGELRETVPLGAPLIGEGFHQFEENGTRWTDGDARLARDLVPVWRGEARLRVRGRAWLGGPPPALPRPHDHPWLAQFESLGDNCEFGLVLKHFGVRSPLSLFRWAATDDRRLLTGLEDGFAGLTRPEHVEVISGDPDLHLLTPYAELHTFQSAVSTAPESLAIVHRQVVPLVRLLRRTLLAKMADGRKIFVFKSEAADFDEAAMRRLRKGLDRYGRSALVCVTQARPGQNAGEVRRLAAGLYAARVARFVMADGPYDEWLQICRETWRMHQDAFRGM